MAKRMKAAIKAILPYLILFAISLGILSSNLQRFFSFQSDIKITRRKTRKLSLPHTTPRFPNLMLCSYQSHSRHKVMARYPEIHSSALTNLYKAHKPPYPPIDPKLDQLNLTEFLVKTRSDVIKVACAIGQINCLGDWRAIATPMGLCYELKLIETEQYLKTDPTTLANGVLGLIIAVNISDSTYGWHGYRSGLSLYYYHWTQPQTEYQELSLTSEMTLAVELMMSRTTYLDRPFTHCSNDNEAEHCYRRLTEEKVLRECGCMYGLIHNLPKNNNNRRCNYTDMVHCVNNKVEDFLFNRDESIEESCPPPCLANSFFAKQVSYRDQNKRAVEMIHKQTNLSDDFQVFFVELELKMNEVELSEEKVSYPAGEMLGDMGGVFGFFLGVTMLNCLQNSYEYLKLWQRSFVRKAREKQLKQMARITFTNNSPHANYKKLLPWCNVIDEKASTRRRSSMKLSNSGQCLQGSPKPPPYLEPGAHFE